MKTLRHTLIERGSSNIFHSVRQLPSLNSRFVANAGFGFFDSKIAFVCLLLLFLGFTVQGQTTFNYTGATQNYTVPSGVTTITVDGAGAEAGAA